MSLAYLAIKFFVLLLVSLFAFAGTFFCIFIERILSARLQHRDGPGVGGKIEYFQVWKDFSKIRRRPSLPVPVGRRLMMLLWSSLPLLFLFILLGGLLPVTFRDAGLWLLILILLVSVVMEALLLHYTNSDRERLVWRNPLLLKILGVSATAVSCFALAMRVGDSDLPALSTFQENFPFHSMLMSPGLFVLSIFGFISIYVVIGDTPIDSGEEKSLSGASQYQVFFIKRMWAFSLIAFWVFLFIGGFSGFFPKVLFFVKTAVFLFVYILLQISVPSVRVSDASSLALRWMLMFGFIGFALEVAWMGFFL